MPLDLHMLLDVKMEASDGFWMASLARSKASVMSWASPAHVESTSLLGCLGGFRLPYLMSIYLPRCRGFRLPLQMYILLL